MLTVSSPFAHGRRGVLGRETDRMARHYAGEARVRRRQPDDDTAWGLDQPVQVDHKAALCVMVIPLENLMVLPSAPRAAGRSNGGDFEFRRRGGNTRASGPTG